ncbi:MAG: prolyl-tRNA synthetase associated domain-containing protein [Rubricella sp.]
MTHEPLDETALLALFDRLGLRWRLQRHPAFHTVEEAKAGRIDLPGIHTKNMFLKGKDGTLALVTCGEDRRIRIRDLEKALGLKKMSFGKADLLWEVLGVRPGAVTPFALVNDTGRRVCLILDAQMMEADAINAHPLHNEATVAMSPGDMLRVFEETGHDPLLVDFDALEAQAAARAA